MGSQCCTPQADEPGNEIINIKAAQPATKDSSHISFNDSVHVDKASSSVPNLFFTYDQQGQGEIVEVTRQPGNDGKRSVSKRGALAGGQDWISVQVLSDLFQMRGSSFRAVRDIATSQQWIEDLNSIEGVARAGFSLTNMGDQMIALTGGEDASEDSANRRLGARKDNYCFNIETLEWKRLPDCQVGVKMHGSCFINTDLYLVGGLNEQDDPVGTIQKLANACSVTNFARAAQWQIINLDVVSPRVYPAVAKVNETSFAIIGGVGANELEEDEVRGDVIVFDTQTQKAEMRVKFVPGLLAVFTVSQAVSVGDETVVVFGGKEFEESASGSPIAVEFKLGNKMLKKIGQV